MTGRGEIMVSWSDWYPGILASWCWYPDGERLISWWWNNGILIRLVSWYPGILMVKYWYPDGEIMVSWSDWYPQSNSPALSFTRAAPTSGKTWLESRIKLHQTCVLFSWRFTKTERSVFFHFVFLRCWSLEVACNPQSSESWRQIVPIYYKQPQ